MSALRVNSRVAWDVLRSAWSFYRRHFILIAAISLTPALQRLVSQLWGDTLPGALNVALEVVTMLARVVLVGLIIWLGILRDPELRRLPRAEKSAGVTEFLRHRWLAVVVFLAMLTAATLVFDTVPEQLVGPMVPAAHQPTYMGVLLAVKNVTVIAFTFVWWVMLAREAMRFRTTDTDSRLAAAAR